MFFHKGQFVPSLPFLLLRLASSKSCWLHLDISSTSAHASEWFFQLLWFSSFLWRDKCVFLDFHQLTVEDEWSPLSPGRSLFWSRLNQKHFQAYPSFFKTILLVVGQLVLGKWHSAGKIGKFRSIWGISHRSPCWASDDWFHTSHDLQNLNFLRGLDDCHQRAPIEPKHWAIWPVEWDL